MLSHPNILHLTEMAVERSKGIVLLCLRSRGLRADAQKAKGGKKQACT
jgi:hypothetical protein